MEHAEGCARLSEEQHAENGMHHLNLLLLNHFSSNFVFVITYYHAARQKNWKTLSSSFTCREKQQLDNTAVKPKKVTAKLAKNFGGKTNHWKTCQGPCNLVSQHDMIYFGACIGAVKCHLSLWALCTKRNSPLLICSSSNAIVSSPSFNEKTTAGFEGGGCDVLDSKVYLFIDSHQLGLRWGLTTCLPGGTVGYPAPPRLIRLWVRLFVMSVHACRLGIERKIAQAQQIRSIILQNREPMWIMNQKFFEIKYINERKHSK